MVRRLVEEQQLGLPRQLAGDRQPLAPAARRASPVGCSPSVKPARPAPPRRAPSFSCSSRRSSAQAPRAARALDGRVRVERRVLRHVTDDAGAARRARPGAGSSSPARMRSSVVLPEPFGPTSPMWSPSKMPSESPSNSGAAPKAFESSWQLRRAAQARAASRPATRASLSRRFRRLDPALLAQRLAPRPHPRATTTSTHRQPRPGVARRPSPPRACARARARSFAAPV